MAVLSQCIYDYIENEIRYIDEMMSKQHVLLLTYVCTSYHIYYFKKVDFLSITELKHSIFGNVHIPEMSAKWSSYI